mgnify:CR=1 FL=1
MQIMRSVNRVPGGLMVVPLFIGMLLNAFAPNLLKIGGFTQALTGVGYPTVLGMYLFTVGTKIPGIGLSASNKKQSLAESAGFFYATGLAGLPLLSLGYRF